MINSTLDTIAQVLRANRHLYDTRAAKATVIENNIPTVTFISLDGEGQTNITATYSVIIKHTNNRVLNDQLEETIILIRTIPDMVLVTASVISGTEGFYAEIIVRRQEALYHPAIVDGLALLIEAPQSFQLLGVGN